MSKILAQGMITLTQLYEGAQVILTPSAVLIPCDSQEAPKPNAYINAFTNVKVFLGTMDITSGITLGALEYSDSTVRASKAGTKVSITTITTRTGYVDIPVSVTIDGETIDLGKHRFSFVKQIDGQTGQPGIQGDPGFSYTLNIKGGTRGVAYAANGTNPEPKTSSQFSVELLKNGVKVANPASISWTCGGNLSGSSSAATFTPTIKSTYNSESSYVKVSVKEFAASLAVEETIPIICTKHADGLDWINEWNNQYVQVGTEKIITPKIFAGTKSSSNELTGVAIGRDVLGGNANKVIGIVGYKKNTPVFSLDQDANFFVSSSGSAGDIKNGTNNAKGIYFDGNNLYVSGKVKISGGSTIGENNTSVEEVINNSNLGAQANNKIDNLSIGGRNLIRKADLAQNTSTATYDGATNTWTVNATAGAGGTLGCGLVVKNKNALVPYGKSYVLSFEIKVPRACSWNCDVNNYALTGSSWSGNDNDNKSKRSTSSKSLVANQWIKCWVKWENTNSNNTNKVDIYDNSNFGVVMKDETSNMTYQIRNVKGELGNMPTEWTPAPEDVQIDINNAIDNIQIGGRNLVSNSNFGGFTSNAYGFGVRKVIGGLKNNTTYTFSANGRSNPNGNTEGKILRCFIYETKWEHSWHFGISETSDTTRSLTFTTGNTIEGKDVYVAFYWYPSGGDRTGNATINWCKVEQGNKPTDWSPAPEDMENAYTIILTNEAQVIPTDSSRKPTSSVTYSTDIQVYKGSAQRTDYTIGAIDSANGITVSKTSSRVNFAVSTGTALTVDGGNFIIPITIDGKTFNKTFSWSCSKQGNTGATGNAGQDAITIVLSNENHTFPCESDGNIPTALSTTCAVTAYKGGTSITPTIGAITNPTGMTITKNGAILTIQANTGTSLADSGTVNIPITVDGKTFNKTFTWSKAKKGATGATGAGAKTVDIVASSQVFKSTDGGITFFPDTITLTPSLQNVTFSKWQYSTDGGRSWSNVSSGSNGLTVSDNNLQISKSSNLFTSTNTTVVFKVITNDSAIYDTMTIVKLYDVTELEIGGTNLLTGTKDFSNGKNTGAVHSEKYNGFTVLYKDFSTATSGYSDVCSWNSAINVKQNTEYTLSFYAKGSGDIISYFYPNNVASGYSSEGKKTTAADGAMRHTLTNNWKRYWIVWKTLSNTSGLKNVIPMRLLPGATGYICGVKFEEGNKATDWSPAPEDLDKNISDVKNSLDSFQNTVNTTFKDGIIEQAEAKAIAQHLKTLDAEKADIDKEYSTIYGNSLLGGTAKTNLANAKTSFDSAHNSLKSTINTAISDGKVTSTEKANVDSTFTTYNGVLGTYKQRVQEALDAIGSAKVDNIQIGGRNLISPAKVQAYTQYSTVTPNNANGWTITKKETSETVAIKQSDFTPEVGKTYTFSGYATVNGQPVSEGFFRSNRLNTYLQPADRIVVNNGYFEVVQKWNASSVWILHCPLAGVTNGVVVDFSNLMLEEGNKASAYTKNPNDIDAEISAVNDKAQDSINKLTELASDSKLTASEKLVAKREWDVIVGEKTKITSEADKFGVSKTDYESKYNTLNSYITPLLSNLTTTSDINGSTFRSNFTNYYNSRQDLLNAISTKIKTLADNAQSTANTANNTANSVNTTVNNNKNDWSNAYNRVKEWAKGAVTGSVDIDGGKIAANTIIAEKIAVGDFNNYATVSELNPATMLPPSHFGGTKIVSPNSTTTEIAKTNSSNDYLMLSGFIPTPFVVNDELLISFKAYNCLSEDKAVTFSVWYYDANKKYLNGNSVAITLTSKTWKQYEVSLKLTSIDTNVRYVVIGFRDSNGTDLRIRNPRVVRKSMGKMIVDGTIEARHIKSDVLSASTIVSTINNGTTTISGGKITSGTITATQIASGSITAAQIASDSITADKLTIGMGESGGLSKNPRFTKWSGTYPDGTSAWVDGGISKVSVDGKNVAQFTCSTAGKGYGMNLSSSFFGAGTNLEGIQYFVLECKFRLTSGTNPSGACFLFDIRYTDDTYQRLILNMTEAGSTLTTNTWYTVRKVFMITDANLAKTFKSVNGFLLGNWTGVGDAVKTIQFASANVYIATKQDYLTQTWTSGTEINGASIKTGTLSADKITTGTLDANKVNVTNIKAGNIVSGTIDASKISVTNLNASNITSGTLSATRMNVKGLTVSNGSVNTLAISSSGNVDINANSVKVNVSGTYKNVADISLKVDKTETILNQQRAGTRCHNLGAKINYSSFSASDEGEIYLHGFDSNNNPSDSDGTISFNGKTYTIKKGMINPNNQFGTRDVYLFTNVGANTNTYGCYYDETNKKWKYIGLVGSSSAADCNIDNKGFVAFGQFRMASSDVFDYAYLYEAPTMLKNVATSFSTINSRLTSAESKITDNAIINTVQSTINTAKNDAINSANSTTDNKLKNYATTSSLTQTANDITASFKASGGYNLIANSTGYNGTNLWSSGGATMGTAINNNIGGATNKYMYLDNGTKTTESFAFSKRFKLKANTKYTLSGWFHNFTKCPNFDVLLLSSTTADESVTDTSYTNVQTLIATQNTSGSWKKFSITFTTPANVISGYIRIDNNGYNASGTNSNRVHWSALMLNEGEEQPWTPHPNEIYSGSTVIDASGVTVNNGALRVKNNAGNTVLSGDSNGNLVFTGTAKSQKGDQFVSMDAGGLTFQDWNKSEQILRVGISSFSSNRDMNGISFAMPQYSDFIRFSHIAKPDLTNGWSSTDTQYNFMDFWSSNQTVGGVSYKKGINVYSPMYVNNGIQFFSGTDFPSEIQGAVSWDNGKGTIWNMMGLYGDNGAVLGYKNGSNLQARILVSEATHPGTNDNIRSWGNWNLSGSTIHNGAFSGNHVNSYANTYTRTSAQTHCIEAEQKQIRVNFEDVQLVEGKAILNIPRKYVGIHSGYIVSSIVKKGRGDVWVSEELENRFILEGTDDIKVNVEVVIKLEEVSSYSTRTADDLQLCFDMPTEQPIL